MYKVTVDVLLRPVTNTRGPTVQIQFDQQQISVELTEPTWYKFETLGSADTSVTLEIEHYGKKDTDTDVKTGADVAVVVEEIKVNGISSPRFVWAGIYRPDYPPHLVDQPKELKYSNYLGWNGVWSLDIGLPSFTWIHHIENLGWIYE